MTASTHLGQVKGNNEIYNQTLITFLGVLLFCRTSSTQKLSIHVTTAVNKTMGFFLSFFLFFVGLGILLDATDNEYMIECCGVVTEWEFYVKTNPGTIQLQIWRPEGAGQYKLVGENSYTVTGGGIYIYLEGSI